MEYLPYFTVSMQTADNEAFTVYSHTHYGTDNKTWYENDINTNPEVEVFIRRDIKLAADEYIKALKEKYKVKT